MSRSAGGFRIAVFCWAGALGAFSNARAQMPGVVQVSGTASGTASGHDVAAPGDPKLLVSCFSDALAKDADGQLAPKVREFLRLQSQITLYKIARFQLLQMRTVQSPEIYDVEMTIAHLIRQKAGTDWTALHPLRKREFIFRAMQDFPDLLAAGSDTGADGAAFRFDSDDLTLLGLHASEEAKWNGASGMSENPDDVRSVLDFARVVNRSFRERNVVGLSADERDREIASTESVLHRLNDQLNLKGSELIGLAGCSSLVPVCNDCRGNSGKFAIAGLLGALSEEAERNKQSAARFPPALRVDQLLARYGTGSLFLPPGPEVVVDPPSPVTPPGPPTKTRAFFPDPFATRYHVPPAQVPPAPYDTGGDPNRATILRAYAEGVADGTECDHFGVVNKQTGTFEIFSKNDLTKHESVVYAVTGSIASDEDTRWVNIENHDGTDTTPAGSFILDQYPPKRSIAPIFGSKALLVYGDSVRDDARQGRLSETNVMTVHAIPEPPIMNAAETALRKKAIRDLAAGHGDRTKYRHTNGCINLDDAGYAKILPILGHRCRMYVLPEIAGDAFSIGADRRLRLTVSKPKYDRETGLPLTDAQVSQRYQYTRDPAPTPDLAIVLHLPEESDLLHGTTVRADLPSGEADVLDHLRKSEGMVQSNARTFAEALATTHLKSSVKTKYHLFPEDYGTLAKLAYAIYGEEYLYGAGGKNETQFPAQGAAASLLADVADRGWTEALRCHLGANATAENCAGSSGAAESPFRTLFRNYNQTLSGTAIRLEKRGKISNISLGKVGTAPDDTAVVLMDYLGRALADVRAVDAKPADPLRALVARLWGKDAAAPFSDAEERKFALLKSRMGQMTLNEVAPRIQVIPKQVPGQEYGPPAPKASP